MEFVKKVKYLVLAGAILFLCGFLLALLNPIIGIVLKPETMDYFLVIHKVQTVCQYVGAACCAAGYILLNELGNWSWIGRFGLVAASAYLVHGLQKSMQIEFLPDLPIIYFQTLDAVELATISLYFIVTFVRRPPKFKFSYSVWGTINFGLVLLLQPFLDGEASTIVFFGLLLLIPNVTFSIIALRYSMKLISERKELPEGI